MESYWGVFKSSAFRIDLSETNLLISTAEVIAGHPQVSVTIIWDNSPHLLSYTVWFNGEVPERNSAAYVDLHKRHFFLHRVNAYETKFTTCDIAQVTFNNCGLLREQLWSQITKVCQSMTYWLYDPVGIRRSCSASLSITKVRLLTAPPLLGC